MRGRMAMLIGWLGWLSMLPSGRAAAGEEQQVDALLQLLVVDGQQRFSRLALIERGWRDDLIPMVIEVLPFVRSAVVRSELVELLGRMSGQDHGADLEAWRQWLWAREPLVHPLYAEFKGALYGLVDPRFGEYFGSDRPTLVRLDEIRWGGVVQNGIPPLRNPEMVSADQAGWLEDDHVVFGLVFAGEARAYPRRVLAWHELVLDEIQGVPIAGVYCTLCQTMIVFRTEIDGVHHELGTSGFLYRSNKLMFDQATASLWSTLLGEPVVGPLAGTRLALPRVPVVVTTWGAWRRLHPKSGVLSLATGHQRDYSEGTAYRDYFASADVMFSVPGKDRRLADKASVLGIRLPGHPGRPVAVSADYLHRHPVAHLEVSGQPLVVLSDSTGASRVYRCDRVRIASWNQTDRAKASDGRTYQVSEAALIGPRGERLERLPTHQSFWFAWRAAFPATRLVR